MELHVWLGDYGLASVSVECLKSILYVKLSKAPVQIVLSNNPYAHLLSDYPIFRHGNVALTDFGEITSYLNQRNYSVDYGLSGKQISEAYALVKMVDAGLKPVCERVMWVDDRNYNGLTAVWFRRVMPFPFAYSYLYRRRKEALAYEEMVISKIDVSKGDENVKEVIRDKAIECFACLATRLGQNEYFYGNCPTTLDMVVYSYLTVLMKIPYPSDCLLKLLSRWPQLYKYVERIDKTLFPEIDYQKKYVKQFDVSYLYEPKKNDKEGDDVSMSVPMKIFVVAAISFLMLGYAVSNKMVDTDRWKRVIIG